MVKKAPKLITKKKKVLLTTLEIVFLVAGVVLLNVAGKFPDNSDLQGGIGLLAIVLLITALVLFLVFRKRKVDKNSEEEYIIEKYVARGLSKADKKLAIQSEKERVKQEGLILCYQKDLEELVKKDSFDKCPICKNDVIRNDNYVANLTVVEDQVIKGSYVTSGRDGLVKQAHQHVEVKKEFPATLFSCPHCEWQLLISEYTTLDYVEYKEKDEDGDLVSHWMYEDVNRTAKMFYRGKLYDKLERLDCEYYDASSVSLKE